MKLEDVRVLQITQATVQEKFIEFGFYFVIDHGVQKPQCVLCYEVLSNESMKEHKLQRPLSSKHHTFKDRDRSFFERKLASLKSSRFDKQGKIHQNKENALEASYGVLLCIAKAKKPHTIDEELVMPCAKDVVSEKTWLVKSQPYPSQITLLIAELVT